MSGMLEYHLLLDQTSEGEIDGVTLPEPNMQLGPIHAQICARRGCGSISHISVAIYDPGNDLVKTFSESHSGSESMGHHEAHLADVATLLELNNSGRNYLINRLTAGGSPRLNMLYSRGIRSSMTVPVRCRDRLCGFIFFNSTERGFFRRETIDRLGPYAQLISLLLVNQIATGRFARAITTMAIEMSRSRSDESAVHLERMARYARLTAVALAPKHRLSDEFVEHLFWYAPLHDIGKVAIPDAILFKPGPLSRDERSEMELHVNKGVAILEGIVQEYGLDILPHAAMARNIIAYHHENVDGSGYPAGIEGSNIPIEARIVAIADVFDALTSERPYKQKWTNEDAVAHMLTFVGTKFDADCLEAFLSQMDKVNQVQSRFQTRESH